MVWIKVYSDVIEILGELTREVQKQYKDDYLAMANSQNCIPYNPERDEKAP